MNPTVDQVEPDAPAETSERLDEELGLTARWLSLESVSRA